MAYRRALMEDIENVVTRVIAEGSENKLREDARWLASLSEASPQLSSQEINKIREKLARVQVYLRKFDQERRQKNNEHHLEMRRRSDEAVLRDREIFRRILVSLLVDTERRSKAKLLELKEAAEEIQKLQLWLAQRIQELEDEYEDNGRRLEELNRRARELEESIARRNGELIELLHKSAWLLLLRKFCPHLSDQEFNRRVDKVYTDTNITNDQLGSAIVQELGLEDQPEAAELLATQIDPQEQELRQSKLAENQQDQEEHQQNRTEATAVESKMNRIAENLDKLRQEFLVKSANLEASYQVLQELVLDLRGKIKRKEKVDPEEMEYLNQIDAELARRNLPDEPHHVHDVIKSLIMKTAIAAALLEVPGRIAERQQGLKSLRSEVGAINEELRSLKRRAQDLDFDDPASIELDRIEASKRKLLSNYKGQQQALEEELAFLSAPPEELQQRLENGDQELTKLLGIGIPCEPVPKVVLAAFLPEGNKSKAKSEAEVSLVKSRKPEETLEDELKPKGFGLGLK